MLIQNEYFWLCFQAVQIQLLRLIQYFCNDNTESLHHFLSRTEYLEYCDIAAETAPCTVENCTKGELLTSLHLPPRGEIATGQGWCYLARGWVNYVV